MKNFTQYILTILFFMVGLTTFAQVGIGTTTANPAAILEIKSTTKGFLPPRLSQSQMNAIQAPIPEGLMVFCTTCSPVGIYYYEGTSFLPISFTESYVPLRASLTSQLLGNYVNPTFFDNGDLVTVTIDYPVTMAFEAGASGTINIDGVSFVLDTTASDPANGKLVFSLSVGSGHSIKAVDFDFIPSMDVLLTGVTENGNPVDLSVYTTPIDFRTLIDGNAALQSLASDDATPNDGVTANPDILVSNLVANAPGNIV
ncbi:hypothetical protein [Polaribacter sp. HL-MS24]|uniref:hypothetical protein n=1 Tax=Polaribacter sp. HL-MS24 TaxID=3077735 RepID=UPI002934FEC7|nr:hypothetical protein [Polaribacter sp. HL-MS24]WOC39441.1 hypothetical protein RRF69_07055 [Polaribacter sp. HL-MS24]